jgi:hypothetical protein
VTRLLITRGGTGSAPARTSSGVGHHATPTLRTKKALLASRLSTDSANDPFVFSKPSSRVCRSMWDSSGRLLASTAPVCMCSLVPN